MDDLRRRTTTVRPEKSRTMPRRSSRAAAFRKTRDAAPSALARGDICRAIQRGLDVLPNSRVWAAAILTVSMAPFHPRLSRGLRVSRCALAWRRLSAELEKNPFRMMAVSRERANFTAVTSRSEWRGRCYRDLSRPRRRRHGGHSRFGFCFRRDGERADGVADPCVAKGRPNRRSSRRAP